MISLQVNSSGFNRQVSALLAQSQRPASILMGMGRELGNLLKTHFREKDKTDVNKLAPDRRQHFWLQVSRSVNQPEMQGAKAVGVRVSDPRIAQKVFGGAIVAKRARLLTIPVGPEAYNRTAATFERETGLKLFLLKEGKGEQKALVLAAKRGPGQLEIEYVLTRKVNQKPDPTALPTKEAMQKAVLERGQKMIDRELKAKAKG
jgi:hypothetical protein